MQQQQQERQERQERERDLAARVELAHQLFAAACLDDSESESDEPLPPHVLASQERCLARQRLKAQQAAGDDGIKIEDNTREDGRRIP